jgi:phenylacetate-CoA ligase
LQAVLRHAQLHVPHYREQLAGRDLTLDPRDLAGGLGALLPVLDKETLRSQAARLRSDDAKGPFLFRSSTSGTTGTPVQGWRNLPSIGVENAFVERQLMWAGWRPGDRRVWLRGDRIVPLQPQRSTFWRHDRADNCLWMSSYHLREDTVPGYGQALARFRPVIIQAYPSAAAYLGQMLLAAGRRYRDPALLGVVTSSESLSQHQRSVIEEAFGVPVYDWYGQFERVIAIGTCEQGNYHLMPSYGLTEMQPCGDGTSELIGTGFHNPAMPLIRYRTVDRVVPADRGYLCPCGRHFPVIEQILGREDDQIVTGDGRPHIAPDFIFDGLPGLLEAQFVQPALNEIRIRVATQAGFGAPQEALLKQRAQERFGAAVAVHIDRVAAIERSSNGKFRGVVRTVGSAGPTQAPVPASASATASV